MTFGSLVVDKMVLSLTGSGCDACVLSLYVLHMIGV